MKQEEKQRRSFRLYAFSELKKKSHLNLSVSNFGIKVKILLPTKPNDI